MSLRDCIRKIRIQKNYSQQFISDNLGISQSKFNRIENGQTDISINELFQICQLLKINHMELLHSCAPSQSQEYEAENGERALTDLCERLFDCELIIKIITA